MDSTRISLARVLALDVPLSWQDAVAIMREVAVLAEMNAAWNDQPSLVRADRCFITTDGTVELPDTTERDSPAELVALLGLLLRGRGAPDDIAALAGRRVHSDLSGALTAVAVGDRHAMIAAVATRALDAARGETASAALQAPSTVAADGDRAAATSSDDPAQAVDDRGSAPETVVAPPPRDDTTRPVPPLRPVVVPLRAARAAAPVAAWAPEPDPLADEDAPLSSAAAMAARTETPMPRIIRPPFVAAPAVPSPASSMPVAPGGAMPDDHASRELERLRQKSAAMAPASSPALRRLLPWVYWRPDGVDPRLVGGAALVLSATVAFIIGTAPRPDFAAPEAPGGASARTPRPVVSPASIGAGTPRPSTPPAGVAATAAMTTGAAPPQPAPDRFPVPADALGSPVPSDAFALGSPVPAGARGIGSLATPAAAATSAGPRRPRVDRAEPATAVTTGTTPSALTTPSTAASTWVEGGGRPPAGSESRPSRARNAGAALPDADAPLSRWLPPSRAPLYSVGDSGVTPPVMRRQQLPSMLLEPRASAPENWPFLELVIDERGAVEAVRLRAVTVAPGQTLYRQRMLVAAAKAWQFDPATRDGVPVRFLMRVPLEP